jgi:DNA-binding NtrC family response regulator
MAMSSAVDTGRSVLVLEDDVVLAETLKDFLEESGWRVECTHTTGDARSKLETEVFDLVLADYLLPDDPGIVVFEEIHRRSPLTRVMLMTGVQDMEVAAQAFRKGADGLLPKPFDIPDLEERIEELMASKTGIFEEDDAVSESAAPPQTPKYIVGESRAIRKVLRLVEMVAGKKASVLITGESGTGKELIAKAIHDLSPRCKEPFVAINCGAIPENLLEDELFGHVRGAYTDARQPRQGKLEQASKGTLFLDEIGEMTTALQIKLLRVLEEKTFQRLGSNETVRVDFRLVAATNSNLWEKVKEGQFREDLFYRLNVVPIQLPPLRDRKEDLGLLANHFLKGLSKEYQDKVKKLTPDSLKLLAHHDWPGNIRELRNVVELAFILAEEREVITDQDLPTLSANMAEDARSQLFDNLMELPEDGINLNQVVSEVEKNLIFQSLQRTNGNKGKAARLLELKRTTLVEKLRRMKLLEDSVGQS